MNELIKYKWYSWNDGHVLMNETVLLRRIATYLHGVGWSIIDWLSNAMHGIGQNIKSRKRPFVRPSGVCGQDCDVIYGPIFTKFGT